MDVNTRFLIISDTHGEPISNISQRHADIAIHCGDLTEESKLDEFRAALKLLREIDAPLKLVIAGNHDFTMDIPAFKEKLADNPSLESGLVEKFYSGFGDARELFEDSRAHGIVSLDEGVHRFSLQNGALLTVYASPYRPSLSNWGFQYPPQEGHEFAIEKGVDVVVTHGPPHGILDLTDSRKSSRKGHITNAGAASRRNTVSRATRIRSPARGRYSSMLWSKEPQMSTQLTPRG